MAKQLQSATEALLSSSCPLLHRRRVFEYADGQLEGATLSLIRQHVIQCKRCGPIATKYEQMRLLLGDHRPHASDSYDPWRTLIESLTDPDWLAFALADSIVLRDTTWAWALIREREADIYALTPATPTAASTIGYLAMWLVEMGMGHVGTGTAFSSMYLVETVLRRFPANPRPRMTAATCLYLEITEGLVALQSERNAEAVDRLKALQPLLGRVGDPVAAIVATGALARAYARTGDYIAAERQARRAARRARTAGFFELSAAYDTRRAWTILQMHGCESPKARTLLKRAADVLEDTNDYISRGNICAAMAKADAHSDFSDKAIARYDQAIDLYGESDLNHPNRARAYVNRAQVLLQSVRCLRRAGRTEGWSAGRSAQLNNTVFPTEAIAVRLESVEDSLQSADKIYQQLRDVHGRGLVLMARTAKHIAMDNFAAAAHTATTGYELARRNGDRIVMARALIQLCQIAHHLAAQTTDANALRVQMENARQFIGEANILVRRIQHSRLKIRTWIWIGLTRCHPYFGATPEAQRYLNRAKKALRHGTRDFVWDELKRLEEAVARAVSQSDRATPTPDTAPTTDLARKRS
jgi:tetratricopeptide (TPR) repeat protein